jgi:hypothetical protein
MGNCLASAVMAKWEGQLTDGPPEKLFEGEEVSEL